jgi:hypothetical protein
VGGAPAQKMGFFEILKKIPKVDWLAAFNSLFGSHIWWGNWSFLSVRSWMYRVFEYASVLVVIGILLRIIRSRSAEHAQAEFVRSSHLCVLLTLYAGFLVAIAHHVLITFIDTGNGASAGWYVYAVVVPEAILVVASLTAFKGGKYVLIGIIPAFFLLEIYSTHWILIPYYTGLIAHTAGGALQSFHPSQLNDIGFPELLARLEVNRPFFLTNGVLVSLWVLYLTASAALVYASQYLGSRTHLKRQYSSLQASRRGR